MDDDADELRSRVLKLEQLVGALVWTLDAYVPRSIWVSPAMRYDKQSRQQLDHIIEMMKGAAHPTEPPWPQGDSNR